MKTRLLRLVVATVAIPMAAAAGSAAFATTATTATTATSCTSVLAGTKVKGDVVVPSGGNCTIQGQKVTGGVTVAAGGTLFIGGGSKVGGSVTSTSAGTTSGNQLGTGTFSFSVIICDSTVGGSIAVSGSPSQVLIGYGCGGTKIHGGVTVSGNSGGVQVWSNTVGGSVSATGNSTVAIASNKIAGYLSCSGNTSVTSGDPANKTVGPKTGQCAGL